ncbi:hypothetical protein C8R44DRAFT_880942 [Mycena epipterygia]|nr:hypothetical protein C8R44DRAFT_880942 [Mycena epipterygia]
MASASCLLNSFIYNSSDLREVAQLRVITETLGHQPPEPGPRLTRYTTAAASFVQAIPFKFPGCFVGTVLTCSLIEIAIHNAPVRRDDFVPLACTGSYGAGTCTPLNVDGSANGPCTNVSGVLSLVLNKDNDCIVYECAMPVHIPADYFLTGVPDCNDSDGIVTECFQDDSRNLSAGIQSVSCQVDPGTVNDGFTQGSPKDITREAKDAGAL